MRLQAPTTNEPQRVLSLLVRGAALLALVVVGAQLWTHDLDMGERLVGTSRVVSEVDRGGAAERAGIAVGDVIVADPGLDSNVAERTEREGYAFAYRLGRAMKSGSVPIRIRRGDEERTVTVVPDPSPSLAAALRQLGRVGSELPVAFAFLAVAVLLARRPSRSERDERARIDVAASSACLGAAWVGAWPAPAWPLWLYPLTSLLETFGTVAGVLLLARFAWSYPTRSRLVDRRGIRNVLVAVGASFATFSSLDSLHIIDAPSGLHGNTVNTAFTAPLGLATLAGLVWQRSKAADLIARRQTTWLLTFCGVGIFVPVVLLLIPHYGLSIPTPPIVHIVFLSVPLLIPVGFAVVVTRFRLFSIDGVAAHAVAYAVAVVASLFVCLAVTLGVDAAFASHAGMGEASRWLGMIVALVVVEPFRRGLQILLDRAFSRDRDELLRRCADLASRLTPLSDRKAIEDEVRAALDAPVVQLLSFGEVLAEDVARSVDSELSRSSVLRVVELRDPSAVDALRGRGFELLLGVPSARADEEDGVRARALALALPGGAHAITRAERDALALVGRVIGAALARDDAWRKLQTEILRADHERRKIAMELHDGIGATLTAARSMARRLRADTLDNAPTLDALDETLRDGLGDLRASLAGLDPAEAEWEIVVANLRRHVTDQCAAEGIAITMQSHGDSTARLAPAGRLTVLRVVQEAVSNAVKHASPRNVRIHMELSDVGIAVEVEDDGTGGARTNGSGRGLGNMVRRVESLGGALRVDDVVPHGTRIAMSLPRAALLLDGATEAESP
jgi:signal transduction histidine kinase